MSAAGFSAAGLQSQKQDGHYTLCGQPLQRFPLSPGLLLSRIPRVLFVTTQLWLSSWCLDTLIVQEIRSASLLMQLMDRAKG